MRVNKEHPLELKPNIKSQKKLKITAKKEKQLLNRVRQCDIFENIEVIENVLIEKDILTIDKIVFPFVICLNQECDLENDFNSDPETKDSRLFHLAIAPVFIFEQFLNGTYWGQILNPSKTHKRTDTTIEKIMNNEIPRYHYLKFIESEMPELIIDFKYFFSINRNSLYSQLNKRLCSLCDLYKEKISQRFSYFISRIGLPDNQV
jgi:hypothetical protein